MFSFNNAADSYDYQKVTTGVQKNTSRQLAGNLKLSNKGQNGKALTFIILGTQN